MLGQGSDIIYGDIPGSQPYLTGKNYRPFHMLQPLPAISSQHNAKIGM